MMHTQSRRLAAASVLLLLLVAVVWPQPDPVPSVRAHQLPADLDAYLLSQEGRYPDLTPGTQKIILWADPQRRDRTSWAVVYLHGFSASRQEISPLPEETAAALGANLYLTRLRGHGRGAEAMGEARAEDWLSDALESLAIGRRLGERILLMGTSTGATLALWLAAQPSADAIAALVLISPNLAPRDPMARVLLWPGGAVIARLVVGEYYSFEPVSPQHARYWTTRYPSGALVQMMRVVDLINKLDLAQIHQPTLVFYSREDQVVDSDLVKRRFRKLGADRKRLVEVTDTTDPSHHVLAGAILSPNTTEAVKAAVLAFIAGLSEPVPLDQRRPADRLTDPKHPVPTG
jgi:alpha-beta hydrolase superfamily lysophospholipase